MNRIMDRAADIKVGLATATATASSGVSTWLSWIPDDIGKLATLFGIIVSTVVIVAHIQLYRKTRKEIELLDHQLIERRKKL